MHDAAFVRILQRSADGGYHGQRIIWSEAALTGQQTRHVHSLDKLHHDVKQAVCRLAGLIHGHDAWVVEARHGTRLVFKPLRITCIASSKARWQDLDRHDTFQADLHAAIDSAHATAPDEPVDDILRQLRLQLLNGWRMPC